jgi:predicted membrane protein
MKLKELFLIQRMSIWIVNNVLIESISMIQGGQDLLLMELTRLEEKVCRVLPIILLCQLSFFVVTINAIDEMNPDEL